MEKYFVERTLDYKFPFGKCVIAKNKDGYEKLFSLRSYLPVKRGTVINVYYDNKGIINSMFAYSYKINGKRVVDLVRRPSVICFYKNLSFVDGCRLSCDIRQALKANGFVTVLSRKDNLRLFYRVLER